MFLNFNHLHHSNPCRLFVVNALQNNRQDKVTEFFEKMCSEIQNQAEWKEWFGKNSTLFCCLICVYLFLVISFALVFNHGKALIVPQTQFNVT